MTSRKVFSEQSNAVACKHLEHLWQHAQALGRLRPYKNPTFKMELLPGLENYGQLIDVGRGRVTP